MSFPRLACGSAPLLSGALPPLAAWPVRCGRVPAGARALSSTIAPRAIVAPISAAQIRALDVRGVVAFVESLGVDADDAQKLRAQKLDGAALLETTVDELCDRYGVLGGPAHTITRAIAPAVAATLNLYPPLKKGAANNPVKVTLTPADFRIKFVLSGAPLRLVSSDGAVLKELMTLEEAVEEASRRPTARLRVSRSFGDDLEEVRGFVLNAAEALEQVTTRALASDAGLSRAFGPLAAVNSAERFVVSQRRGGAQLPTIEVDGLVVGARCALLNSVKHTPTLEHVTEAVAAAEKLQGVLAASLDGVRTAPRGVQDELAKVTSRAILPFLSGNNVSAAVVAECRAQGVGCARPDDSGFAVMALPREPHPKP